MQLRIASVIALFQDLHYFGNCISLHCIDTCIPSIIAMHQNLHCIKNCFTSGIALHQELYCIINCIALRIAMHWKLHGFSYWVTVLQFYFVTVLLCYCITMVFCYCITVLLCYCVIVSLCYCVKLWILGFGWVEHFDNLQSHRQTEGDCHNAI